MNTSLSKLLSALSNNSNSVFFAIDVGAHYGEYTKFLMKTGFFCHIVSFEPNPESYLSLLEQVSSTDNCEHQAVNSALSYKSGTLDLYCDGDSATASLLQYDSNYLGRGQIRTHTVPVLTLDEYLAKHPSLGRLQLLKIDTQGNDLSVIRGGLETIAMHRPIIQTEFIYTHMYKGQCSPTELSDALISLDYEIYSLNNLHITAEGRLAFCDAIFVPKELNIPSTQEYSCIDDEVSYTTQINTLSKICEERLALIEQLDAEVRRLNAKNNPVLTILKKVKSWAQ
jgi:FkbM family methyltransferase